jgi:hypothetical protein
MAGPGLGRGGGRTDGRMEKCLRLIFDIAARQQQKAGMQALPGPARANALPGSSSGQRLLAFRKPAGPAYFASG